MVYNEYNIAYQFNWGTEEILAICKLFKFKKYSVFKYNHWLFHSNYLADMSVPFQCLEYFKMGKNYFKIGFHIMFWNTLTRLGCWDDPNKSSWAFNESVVFRVGEVKVKENTVIFRIEIRSYGVVFMNDSFISTR